VISPGYLFGDTVANIGGRVVVHIWYPRPVHWWGWHRDSGMYSLFSCFSYFFNGFIGLFMGVPPVVPESIHGVYDWVYYLV